MIRRDSWLSGLLGRNPHCGNSRHASLYGSIGISLFAHVLIITTMGFALTPNIQALAGNPLLLDIVTVLELQDAPAEDKPLPIAAVLDAPAKIREIAIETSHPQKINTEHKSKIAQRRKKTPKADPAKLNLDSITAFNFKHTTPAGKFRPPTKSANHDLKSTSSENKSEHAVPPVHDTFPPVPQHHVTAKSDFRSPLQVNNLKIRAPRYNAPGLSNPRPKYPRIARNRGYTGEVLLKINVSKLGTVETVSVAQSSGYALLDHSAIRTIKTWRFLPAQRGGGAIDAEILVPVSFRLIN